MRRALTTPELRATAAGVSPQVIEAADTVGAIPMLGMTNSLNVATAAAILLYWLSVRLERLAAVEPLITPNVRLASGSDTSPTEQRRSDI
jgi:tRNA C32,U32 (ribose-2'-O)-methylase TrmJ